MNDTRRYESEAIAGEYAKHRGIYPQQLADVIMEYAFETKREGKNKLERMVEVGCGSGQITKLMAPHFNDVIASDVSANQIKHAKESNAFDHVRYVLGAAEDLQVADRSVDMVVSAESAFLFDLPRFFGEVARVLKPGGCLAIVSYDFPRCSPPGSDAERSAASCFEVVKAVLGRASYNPKPYAEAANQLTEIFEKVPSDNKIRKFLPWTIRYNLAGYKGLLRSLDAFQNKKLAAIEETRSSGRELTALELEDLDLVEEYGRRLKSVWKMEDRSDEEVEFDTTFNFVILLARDLR